MRACLLALLMLFCLPLQWGAVVDDACAQLHDGVPKTLPQADADNLASDSHALHPHCGGCHAGALAVLASESFPMSDGRSRALSGSYSWTQILFDDRPERPQWYALA
jgi:hypothetical protein